MRQIEPHRAHQQPHGLVGAIMRAWFLKSARNHPIFELGAWRFVNLDQLSAHDLADQLPLLTLVDDQTSGISPFGVFEILMDAFFVRIARQCTGWNQTDPPSAEDDNDGPLQEWITEPRKPIRRETFRLYNSLFTTTAALMMARLAMRGRYAALYAFVEGVSRMAVDSGGSESVRSPEVHAETARLLRWLGIILAAMTHQRELLIQLHGLPTLGSPPDIPDRTRAETCAVADTMRALDLPRGAAFLETVLECASPGMVVVGVLVQQEEEGGSPVNRMNLLEGLHFIEQLSLSEKGGFHMGVAMLVPLSATGATVNNEWVDMGPAPPNRELLKFSMYVNDPHILTIVENEVYGSQTGTDDLHR
ncbi:hypothetical protein H4R33_004090 [Dimargaris cristalligena]|uniref:Uncharacterized protein n=1 Tax=Dimargaris cristalligena TaxID=215637 RepID=A0A4P9ZUC4_9FUNG|nr:hypothetical protein H4R33_004090 [Dimargaris cristalligena]RKP37145.1 hypothetical protein BJ085DRAFT_32018 [Dimargaris cristalligena]|eukprot:RKP37145.1 hypothetical protein BJ085DRAFT_32018 [Dimargaris cristalligena]